MDHSTLWTSYGETCGSPVKTELKKLRWLKSYGQIKIDSEIMAVSYVFLAYFGLKLTPLGQALPRVLRAHLYVFGISRA